jgi:Trk K+ transport system NAD-binding subunit
VKYALPLDDEMLGIAEITVTPGGRLDTLVYKIEQDFNVQVIGYTGENDACEVCWRHRVDPKTRLYGGDRVLLLGTLHALGETWHHGQLRNKIMDTLGISITQRLTPTYNRVIVCGLGKVGYRVVQVLTQLEPRPDVVVLCDPESTRTRFVKDVQALGVQVIYGDARDEELLVAAGIYRAYSVAAVTSNNLSNLRIGLAARQLRSDMHLVLRVFSDVLADQLEGMFGFHTAFSTSSLAAPTLAAAVVVKGTGYAFDVGDRLMSTARLTVQSGDEFDGQRVPVLRERYGMVVISVRRDGQAFLMPGDPAQPGKLFDKPLLPGDEIVLLAEIQMVARLRERGARTDDITSTRRTRRLAPLSTLPEEEQTSAPTDTAAQSLADDDDGEPQPERRKGKITAVLPPNPATPNPSDQAGGTQSAGNDTIPPESQALLEHLLRQGDVNEGKL